MSGREGNFSTLDTLFNYSLYLNQDILLRIVKYHDSFRCIYTCHSTLYFYCIFKCGKKKPLKAPKKEGKQLDEASISYLNKK